MANRTCSVDGCERQIKTRGWCNMHYQRVMKGRPLGPAEPLQVRAPAPVRFWAKVDKRSPDECWLWLAARSPLGYGRFQLGGGDGTINAYRFAYEDTVGPVHAGLELDHLCRNPPCVNPAHLEPVTHRENMRRAIRTHCPQGHLKTPETTWMHKDGSRTCKICDRERQRVAYQRRKVSAA